MCRTEMTATVGGNTKQCSHYDFLKKQKVALPRDPAVALQDIDPTQFKTGFQGNAHTLMLTTCLFTIARK